MKTPNGTAAGKCDELLQHFHAWLDASKDLRDALLRRPSRVNELNRRAHEALATYLQAVEFKVASVDAGRTGAALGALQERRVRPPSCAVMPRAAVPSGETPLEQARRHVVSGERIVNTQTRIVEDLRKGGMSTRQAEELLDTYCRMLLEMRAHLAYEERNGPRGAIGRRIAP